MKVAISGSTGFLGRHISSKLSEVGVPLLHIGRSVQRIHDVFGPAETVVADSVSKLEDCLHDSGVTAVLNLATYFSRGRSPEDISAILDANLLSSVRVFEASHSCAAPFINFNSFWQLLDTSESATPYAASKEAFRVYMQMSEPGRQGTISDVYIPETFGSGDTRNKVVQLAAQAIANGGVFAPKYPDSILDLTFAPLLGTFLKDALLDRRALPRKFGYINFPRVHLASLLAAMRGLHEGQVIEASQEIMLDRDSFLAKGTFGGEQLDILGVSNPEALLSCVQSVLAHASDTRAKRGFQ